MRLPLSIPATLRIWVAFRYESDLLRMTACYAACVPLAILCFKSWCQRKWRHSRVPQEPKRPSCPRRPLEANPRETYHILTHHFVDGHTRVHRPIDGRVFLILLLLLLQGGFGSLWSRGRPWLGGRGVIWLQRIKGRARWAAGLDRRLEGQVRRVGMGKGMVSRCGRGHGLLQRDRQARGFLGQSRGESVSVLRWESDTSDTASMPRLESTESPLSGVLPSTRTLTRKHPR